MSHVWIAQKDGFYEPDTLLGVTRTKQGAKDICRDAANRPLNWVVDTGDVAATDNSTTNYSVKRWDVSET